MKLLQTTLQKTRLAVLGFVTLAALSLNACTQGKTEPVVEFETTQGKIVIQLHPDYAPKTVDLFLKHVDAGFYNNTLFHRVIPEFMAQGGGFKEDFSRKEALGTVVNESTGGLPNTLGTIAMARTSNPDSASSQFYINVVDNPNLDARDGRPGYTVFGTVTQGTDVAIAITQLPRGKHSATGQRNAPNETVLITASKRLKPAAAMIFETPIPTPAEAATEEAP